GSLLENKELILKPATRTETHLTGRLDDPLKQPPRAASLIGAAKLAECEDRGWFTRHQPHRLGAQRHRSIPVASGRSRERPVVVENVAHVPAKNHVAETKALRQHREEFLSANSLAAK